MKKVLTIVAIVIVLALVWAWTNKSSENSLAGGTIRIGYIIYSPSLVKDTVTDKLSGFSYEIVEATAKKIGMKTEWVEEVGWGTALEGLNTNRYDMVGTQMWITDGRDKQALFSISPMDSVSYAYVRKGDKRFDSDLSILNSEKYTISVMDGEITTSIATEDFPKAKTFALPQLSSLAEVFLNVVQKKADITFTEPAAMQDFLASHPNTLERVVDKPLRSYDNSFAFKKGNTELVEEWNKATRELMDSGEVKTILEKYGVADYYVIN